MGTKPNYEIRVGLFTIVALGLLIWGWGWLKSASLLHPPQRFICQFHDVAGLNKNATVNINGVRVGVVEDIKLVHQSEVHTFLKITAENVRVPVGSSFTIQTLGLVGAKYIEISLPETKPGQPTPIDIAENAIVDGQDPVRVEMIVNDVASKIQKMANTITTGKSGKSFERALEKSGEAMENLTDASVKLNNNMDKFSSVADSVNDTSRKMGTVATTANQFFAHGSSTLDNISGLSTDLRGATGKVNKILDSPTFSADWKETVQMARETAKTVSATVHELNTTLGDQHVRGDIMAMLQKISDSTQNISNSMVIVDKVANDQGLRTDIKEAVAAARDAMTKADELMKDANFKSDLTQTMSKMKSAAGNVDLAARQLNQILGKRAPLFHMMLGRPGRIPPDQIEPTQEQQAGVDLKPAH
ncbi:MAG: MlaD family protein [Candidatus Obscuribacterales bacterium]|nr:MlaD family protein [Candidatus Obscuribacterales bacterium]